MTQHPEAARLLREVNLFLLKSGLSATRFGLLVVNDGNFVPRLRGGRTPTLDTIDKVRRYLRSKANVAPRR